MWIRFVYSIYFFKLTFRHFFIVGVDKIHSVYRFLRPIRSMPKQIADKTLFIGLANYGEFIARNQVKDDIFIVDCIECDFIDAFHLNATESIEMKKEGENKWTARITECNAVMFVLEIGKFCKYI